MLWDILILTQPSRATFLARLLAVLEPQCQNEPEARYWFRLFQPSLSIGANRQAMVNQSEAEYVSFIDDDDLVPTDYVSTILPLLDGVDMVGFNVECFTDGKLIAVAKHSLQFGGWWQDGTGLFRDLSYMTPMRRELVKLAEIEGGFGEDRRWADRLRKTGAVKTEHYIDRAMYLYLFRTAKADAVNQ
jgi:hypothetical protein